MLPLSSVPPSPGPPFTEIVNLSVLPGSPLSSQVTVNVHDAPFCVQVPEKVALLPEMLRLVIETLCTFEPLAWLWYSSCPLTGPAVVSRFALNPKFAFPPVTLT